MHSFPNYSQIFLKINHYATFLQSFILKFQEALNFLQLFWDEITANF